MGKDLASSVARNLSSSRDTSELMFTARDQYIFVDSTKTGINHCEAVVDKTNLIFEALITFLSKVKSFNRLGNLYGEKLITALALFDILVSDKFPRVINEMKDKVPKNSKNNTEYENLEGRAKAYYGIFCETRFQLHFKDTTTK